MLQTLAGSNFEPLTKEQLKNVRGGDQEKTTKPDGGAEAGWVAWHGKKYYCKADRYTLNDKNEYTCMEVLATDNTWVDIFNE